MQVYKGREQAGTEVEFLLEVEIDLEGWGPRGTLRVTITCHAVTQPHRDDGLLLERCPPSCRGGPYACPLRMRQADPGN